MTAAMFKCDKTIMTTPLLASLSSGLLEDTPFYVNERINEGEEKREENEGT